jgi:hypothetical protein
MAARLTPSAAAATISSRRSIAPANGRLSPSASRSTRPTARSSASGGNSRSRFRAASRGGLAAEESNSPRTAKAFRLKFRLSRAEGASRWRSRQRAADSPRPRSFCAAAAETVADFGAVAARAYKASPVRPVGSL